MDYQKMIIVGNATKDAEVHQSEGKAAYADFTLAVRRTEDRTTLFPVRVFGKLAEGCENTKKGVKILVDGKLDISDHTDKDGQKRATFRILADAHRLP
jgi:single stranded DNA-binding protein